MAAKDTLTMSDYSLCGEQMSTIYRDSVSLRSKDQTIRTIKTHRKCLSAYDDKQYILDDGVGTLANENSRVDVSYATSALLGLTGV